MEDLREGRKKLDDREINKKENSKILDN